MGDGSRLGITFRLLYNLPGPAKLALPENVLRVALLSLIAPVGPDAGAQASAMPRGMMRLGGHTLARHQLAIALSLGCDRVIVVANGALDGLLPLQHAAESAGALFHRVTSAHGVMGLVSAQDEVIALGDGVLAWPDLAHELLATPAVLVQPVEQGVAAGFERLDFNYASAGAMRFPGRLVERLGELPGDVETFACLQRIALQGGVPQRSVPDDVIAQGRWTLLHNEQEVQAVEPGWISHHLFEDGLRSPSEWLAGQAVRLAGPALLEAGSGGTVVAMAAGVLAALGMVAGGFGAITLGLMLVAAAWLGFACASLFGRFERRSLRLPRPRVAPVVTYRWIVDGVLLALLGLAHGQNGYIAGLFAPLMLLGLIRLVPVLLPIRIAAWIEDRALFALLLGLLSMLNWLRNGVAVFAVALLLSGLIMVGRQNRLTPA